MEAPFRWSAPFPELAGLRLMTTVAHRQKQPVGAGPGLWLGVAGAAIIGFAAYRGAGT